MKRILCLSVLLSILTSGLKAQTFTDSNLPIVIINTDHGVPIGDSPRVPGDMIILWRGEGQRTYMTDINNPAYQNYKGRISIEIRGSSSQTLPKKQYGFSTMNNDNSTERNAALLGMPADNDWIFNGLGFEPSMMRDYLHYNLSRMIGEYASRTAYCEMVLNGSYNGLYVLEEKIKQGKQRVNVTKIDMNDNFIPKVTGGYITKADKTDGVMVAWTESSYIGTNDVNYIHTYPKPEEATAQQTEYIHNEYNKLADAAKKHNSSLVNGFPSVIDVRSFVDFMVLNELGSNADAYMYSTYFHKDRNGKLQAGPIWDMNLTFGYDLSIWGFDRSKYNNWQFSNGDNEGSKFWRDLFSTADFKCAFARRWNELTMPGRQLNYISLEAMINKTLAYIGEAAGREYIRWGTVPNVTAEANKIKSFLSQRIPWVTNTLGQVTCPNPVLPPLVITKIMYRSDSTAAFPDRDAQEFIEITNTGNKTVNLAGDYFLGNGFVYQFPTYSEIGGGASIIIAGNAEVFTRRFGRAAFGQFTRNLADTGESLMLADGFGNLIDSVTYSNQSPWPSASGNGYYLQLTDNLSDNSRAVNWTASRNTLTGVNDEYASEVLRVYPSPVKDELTIDYSSTVRFVELFDSQGRMLKRYEAGDLIYRIDMSAYKPGIYMVHIITRDKILTRKVVKQ